MTDDLKKGLLKADTITDTTRRGSKFEGVCSLSIDQLYANYPALQAQTNDFCPVCSMKIGLHQKTGGRKLSVKETIVQIPVKEQVCSFTKSNCKNEVTATCHSCNQRFCTSHIENKNGLIFCKLITCRDNRTRSNTSGGVRNSDSGDGGSKSLGIILVIVLIIVVIILAASGVLKGGGSGSGSDSGSGHGYNPPDDGEGGGGHGEGGGGHGL